MSPTATSRAWSAPDDYPGAALAAVLAKELGLPGPEPRVSLVCQHKYLSRVAQARIVALPEGVQARMEDIARRLMGGLGFDNGMFNIEMMYDTRADRIAVIEINPRMASQFADLYEKVDGTNAYEVLLDLGTGIRPTPKRRQGKYRFAASCVLRTFEDCVVAVLPFQEKLAQIEQAYPDIRVEIHATAGRRLSDELQDGTSFRYGIVCLGGRDRAEVLRRVPSRAWHRPVASCRSTRDGRAGAVCSP
jgi:biotin carboxylase